ncbi:hypothetical protein BX600DRAFT_480788 [Xylariales sp. PMI_506]|nr:hypothetical protein BX600DRAFT_480788 [Xylariales sp. PMI_506]
MLGAQLGCSAHSIRSSSPALPVNDAAYTFDISQITLNDGRWQENQQRTLNYLKFVDPERMLYVFRANHNLSTNGATANGGWDAPDFPFRSHVQGHLLSAWAQCYSTLKDDTCGDRASSFVQELLKCQNNNEIAGYSPGYLSGFPESDFALLESGTLTNGNVPYYVIHKIMQGLLDVWDRLGDSTAETVLLALAGWVDSRTANLTEAQMQSVLNTEYGGMADVLTDIYFRTSDAKWLTTAQRFDQVSTFTFLAANEDELDGLHANTQVPKWIGTTREYRATENSTYLDIASNAWEMTVNHHTYAIGGNSQAEHFHAPDEIAGYLTTDTCEHCNSYNMLKLTKELWGINPNSEYFDFFERALINHLIGAQNQYDSHGPVTYFTPLVAGGQRGVGPAWGGGTWSTDYDSFWCCMGTSLEQNTKLMDAIYGYDDSSLYINLFAPSTLDWTQQGLTVTQNTDFPVSDTTNITIDGSGVFDLKIRIPSWTSGATVSVNGELQQVDTIAGAYTTISRAWASGDVVTVQLPMTLQLVPANDDPSLAAVAYGPVILSGNYGNDTLSAAPTLDLASVSRTSDSDLGFTGTAEGAVVNLGPFYDAQGFNYVVYWAYSGNFSS